MTTPPGPVNTLRAAFFGTTIIPYNSFPGNSLIICAEYGGGGLTQISDSAENHWVYSTNQSQNPPYTTGGLGNGGSFIAWSLNTALISSITITASASGGIYVSEWEPTLSPDNGSTTINSYVSAPVNLSSLANYGDLVVASYSVSATVNTGPVNTNQITAGDWHAIYCWPNVTGSFSLNWFTGGSEVQASSISVMSFNTTGIPTLPTSLSGTGTLTATSGFIFSPTAVISGEADLTANTVQDSTGAIISSTSSVTAVTYLPIRLVGSAFNSSDNNVINYVSTTGNTLTLTGALPFAGSTPTNITSITDSANNTGWQYSTMASQLPPLANDSLSGEICLSFIAWCVNAQAISSVTVSPAFTYTNVCVSEWANISGPDTGASNSGNSVPANASTPILNLSNSSDLVVCALANSFSPISSSGVTKSIGFTQGMSYVINPGTNTVSFSASLSSNNIYYPYASSIMSFTPVQGIVSAASGTTVLAGSSAIYANANTPELPTAVLSGTSNIISTVVTGVIWPPPPPPPIIFNGTCLVTGRSQVPWCKIVYPTVYVERIQY